jgi:hypothetical protein
LQSLKDTDLGLILFGACLGPSAVDINEIKRLDVVALYEASFVRHKISLDKAWLSLIPIGEGALGLE